MVATSVVLIAILLDSQTISFCELRSAVPQELSGQLIASAGLAESDIFFSVHLFCSSQHGNTRLVLSLVLLEDRAAIDSAKAKGVFYEVSHLVIDGFVRTHIEVNTFLELVDIDCRVKL
jgi:hypothetical protein